MHEEPIDPDIGLGRPDATTALVVAFGGAIGAVGRYEAGLLWPTGTTAFPWTTLGINVIGCLLLSVVVVLCIEVWPGQRRLRPLLGTGLLGGFTTFSTFAVDLQRLLRNGHAAIAVAYLVSTIGVGLAATWLGARLARGAVGRGRR